MFMEWHDWQTDPNLPRFQLYYIFNDRISCNFVFKLTINGPFVDRRFRGWLNDLSIEFFKRIFMWWKHGSKMCSLGDMMSVRSSIVSDVCNIGLSIGRINLLRFFLTEAPSRRNLLIQRRSFLLKAPLEEMHWIKKELF